MSMAVRADLLAAVRVGRRPTRACRRWSIIGANGKFIPGADIREFGKTR